MWVKIIIIIELIELNGMCAKIKAPEYASQGLMCENLAVRKYLGLQYLRPVAGGEWGLGRSGIVGPTQVCWLEFFRWALGGGTTRPLYWGGGGHLSRSRGGD